MVNPRTKHPHISYIMLYIYIHILGWHIYIYVIFFHYNYYTTIYTYILYIYILYIIYMPYYPENLHPHDLLDQRGHPLFVAWGLRSRLRRRHERRKRRALGGSGALRSCAMEGAGRDLLGVRPDSKWTWKPWKNDGKMVISRRKI